MNGVVIRCQHCGTTQPVLGECEACHEENVRYYCPNHTPGRWLDVPSCSACGALVGVPPVKSRTVPRTPPPPPPRPRPPAREPIEIRPRPPRRDVRPERAEEPREEVWSAPVRTSRRVELELLDLVKTMATRAARSGGPRSASPAAPLSGLFGCLRKLVILGVVLFILAMIAFYALFGVGGLLYGSLRPPDQSSVHGAVSYAAGASCRSAGAG